MSQELIKKIMSGKIKLHHTRSSLQKKNIKIENPESVWDEVINQKNDFKGYEPNEEYINMMYALIYVYNSYVDTENEIIPPILNDSYHWDKANRVYVINLGSSNGVYLYDRLRYLTGKGSENSNYVNLYQILKPSSFTKRHKDKFFDAIAKSEFSLQYSPEISTEQLEIKVPRTPLRTPGKDLKISKEELEKSLKNEYSDIFTIHKNIKNLSKLIKDAKEESEIIKNIMSIKTDIYNNILQLEVNIVDKKEMEKIYKKYNKLYTLINQIEEWYNTASAGEGFTKEIEKGLNSRSFKIKEIKGVNLLQNYEEEYEKQGIKSIPNNVMRIWLNYNLYIDVKLN